MVSSMTDKEKAREAAKKAAERARKDKRRRELQGQAQETRTKIAKASDLITQFRKKRTEIVEAISHIKQKKQSALTHQMVSQVRVSKKFEGVIAEKQATNLPKGMKCLDSNIKKSDHLMDGIEDQIQKLQQYQDKNQDKLTRIISQINSI